MKKDVFVDERVFRVAVARGPRGSVFSRYDVRADTIEQAAKKARVLARRDGCKDPSVVEAIQITVIDS